MATTYQFISSVTVGSGGVPNITFNNIPQTYTDLLLKVSARDDRATYPISDLSVRVGYNGTINTGSIYSYRRIYGNGSNAGSDVSSSTYMYVGIATATATANTFGNTELYFPNYTSSNIKSLSVDAVGENNATESWGILNTALASTTNPITDIQISAAYGSGNYQQYSTFYLYGISNA
jgi:hypothetical protein